MIGGTSQETWCGCTPGLASVIDNLPGHPARRVQLQMSVGLLTDGSPSVSAFPGRTPVACSRWTHRLQLRGQFRVAGEARGAFPVISLRKPTHLPSQSCDAHQAAHSNKPRALIPLFCCNVIT